MALTQEPRKGISKKGMRNLIMVQYNKLYHFKKIDCYSKGLTRYNYLTNNQKKLYDVQHGLTIANLLIPL